MEILEFLQSKLRTSLVTSIDETMAALGKNLNTKSKKSQALILLKGRLEDVKNKSIIGTISEAEKQIETNKIRESLLHVINGLQSADIKGESSGKEKSDQPSPPIKESTRSTHSDKSDEIDLQEPTAKGNDFSAHVVTRNQSGKYLSIKVVLLHEEHQIEYIEDVLSPKLLVDGTEVGRKGTSSNVVNILLSGFTFGMIKERGAYDFSLSDQGHNYPSSLKLAFGMSRSFTGIKLTVKGINLIDEGQV